MTRKSKAVVEAEAQAATEAQAQAEAEAQAIAEDEQARMDRAINIALTEAFWPPFLYGPVKQG